MIILILKACFRKKNRKVLTIGDLEKAVELKELHSSFNYSFMKHKYGNSRNIY